MDDYTDQPKEIRKGEDIDSTKLSEFLRDSTPGLEGEIVVQQFPGGRSNLTYMVTFGDRNLVLRRPPFGTKAKTAHDPPSTSLFAIQRCAQCTGGILNHWKMITARCFQDSRHISQLPKSMYRQNRFHP